MAPERAAWEFGGFRKCDLSFYHGNSFQGSQRKERDERDRQRETEGNTKTTTERAKYVPIHL